MNHNTIQLDPISALVWFASFFFAKESAAVVGPYVVILCSSTIGASFALKARPVTSRASAAAFFFRVNGLSLLLTYSIASIVHTYYSTEHVTTWFAPVSFLIGFVGDRWPALLHWAAGKAAKFIDLLIKLRSGDGNG